MLKSLFPWKHNKTKVQVTERAMLNQEVLPEQQLLLPCHVCNRTFLPLPLKKHTRVCEANAKKKRKIFNSLKQRVEGTDLAPFFQKTYLKKQENAPTTTEIYSKPNRWKEKHLELMNTIRAAKGVSSDMNITPKKPSHTNHQTVAAVNERCPSCDRQFGPKAFDRHVEWCKEHKTRIQKSPANVIQAKERLEARTKYRVPPLKQPKRAVTKEKYSPSINRSNSVVGSDTSNANSMPNVQRHRSFSMDKHNDSDKRNISNSKIDKCGDAKETFSEKILPKDMKISPKFESSKSFHSKRILPVKKINNLNINHHLTDIKVSSLKISDCNKKLATWTDTALKTPSEPICSPHYANINVKVVRKPHLDPSKYSLIPNIKQKKFKPDSPNTRNKVIKQLVEDTDKMQDKALALSRNIDKKQRSYENTTDRGIMKMPSSEEIVTPSQSTDQMRKTKLSQRDRTDLISLCEGCPIKTTTSWRKNLKPLKKGTRLDAVTFKSNSESLPTVGTTETESQNVFITEEQVKASGSDEAAAEIEFVSDTKRDTYFFGSECKGLFQNANVDRELEESRNKDIPKDISVESEVSKKRKQRSVRTTFNYHDYKLRLEKEMENLKGVNLEMEEPLQTPSVITRPVSNINLVSPPKSTVEIVELARKELDRNRDEVKTASIDNSSIKFKIARRKTKILRKHKWKLCKKHKRSICSNCTIGANLLEKDSETSTVDSFSLEEECLETDGEIVEAKYDLEDNRLELSDEYSTSSDTNLESSLKVGTFGGIRKSGSEVDVKIIYEAPKFLHGKKSKSLTHVAYTPNEDTQMKRDGNDDESEDFSDISTETTEIDNREPTGDPWKFGIEENGSDIAESLVANLGSLTEIVHNQPFKISLSSEHHQVETTPCLDRHRILEIAAEEFIKENKESEDTITISQPDSSRSISDNGIPIKRRKLESSDECSSSKLNVNLNNHYIFHRNDLILNINKIKTRKLRQSSLSDDSPIPPILKSDDYESRKIEWEILYLNKDFSKNYDKSGLVSTNDDETETLSQNISQNLDDVRSIIQIEAPPPTPRECKKKLSKPKHPRKKHSTGPSPYTGVKNVLLSRRKIDKFSSKPRYEPAQEISGVLDKLVCRNVDKNVLPDPGKIDISLLHPLKFDLMTKDEEAKQKQADVILPPIKNQSAKSKTSTQKKEASETFKLPLIGDTRCSETPKPNLNLHMSKTGAIALMSDNPNSNKSVQCPSVQDCVKSAGKGLKSRKRSMDSVTDLICPSTSNAHFMVYDFSPSLPSTYDPFELAQRQFMELLECDDFKSYTAAKQPPKTTSTVTRPHTTNIIRTKLKNGKTVKKTVKSAVKSNPKLSDNKQTTTKRKSVIDPPASFKDTSLSFKDEFELIENIINNDFSDANRNGQFTDGFFLHYKGDAESLGNNSERKYSDDMSSIDPSLINENDNLSIPEHFTSSDTYSPTSTVDTDATIQNDRVDPYSLQYDKQMLSVETTLQTKTTKNKSNVDTRSKRKSASDHTSLSSEADTDDFVGSPVYHPNNKSKINSSVGAEKRKPNKSLNVLKSSIALDCVSKPPSMRNKQDVDNYFTEQEQKSMSKSNSPERKSPEDDFDAVADETFKTEGLFSVDDEMYEEYKKYEELYLKEKEKKLANRKQRHKTPDLTYGVLATDSKQAQPNHKICNDSAYGSLNRKQSRSREPSLSLPVSTDLRENGNSDVDGSQPQSPLAGRFSKFCHECGNKYPVLSAKFCVECGVKRLVL